MNVLEIMLAGIATMTFSVLFGTPWKFIPYCGMVGGISWGLVELFSLWISESLSVFLATLIVVIVARFFAVKKRCPVTVFILAGIITQVPGAGIYWSAYYVVTKEYVLAAERGLMALEVAIAIVLAIVFALELPHRLFNREK